MKQLQLPREFAGRLRLAMVLRDVSRSQLIRDTGIHYQRLYRAMRGRGRGSNMRADDLIKVCRYLKTDPCFLLGVSDNIEWCSPRRNGTPREGLDSDSAKILSMARTRRIDPCFVLGLTNEVTPCWDGATRVEFKGFPPDLDVALNGNATVSAA
jgi:DNA-binding Xre family transcriptional regulator